MTHSIGRKPPGEPFTRVPAARGEEKLHFLFDFDSAELSGSASKQLDDVVGQYRGALYVDIRGYSNSEGNTAYDLNLAAHRAATVQRLMLPLLPRASEIRLFAHGDTDAWGNVPANRRAGVRVWPAPSLTTPPSVFAPRPLLPPLTYRNPEVDLFGNPVAKPDLTYRPRTEWVEADPRRPAYDPFRLPPLQRPPGVPDWSSLRGPFTNRGLRLNDRDIQSVQDNWNRTYLWGIGLGLSPDTSTLVANKLTTAAYDMQLAREAPNFWDKVDREGTLLGISRSPIVPVITPESLRFVSKFIFKRDLELNF
jgi:OmpA family